MARARKSTGGKTMDGTPQGRLKSPGYAGNKTGMGPKVPGQTSTTKPQRRSSIKPTQMGPWSGPYGN